MRWPFESQPDVEPNSGSALRFPPPTSQSVSPVTNNPSFAIFNHQLYGQRKPHEFSASSEATRTISHLHQEIRHLRNRKPTGWVPKFPETSDYWRSWRRARRVLELVRGSILITCLGTITNIPCLLQRHAPTVWQKEMIC